MNFYDLLFYLPVSILPRIKINILHRRRQKIKDIEFFFYCHFAYKLKQYKIGVAVKGSLNEISRNLHQCIKFQF